MQYSNLNESSKNLCGDYHKQSSIGNEDYEISNAEKNLNTKKSLNIEKNEDQVDTYDSHISITTPLKKIDEMPNDDLEFDDIQSEYDLLEYCDYDKTVNSKDCFIENRNVQTTKYYMYPETQFQKENSMTTSPDTVTLNSNEKLATKHNPGFRYTLRGTKNNFGKELETNLYQTRININKLQFEKKSF